MWRNSWLKIFLTIFVFLAFGSWLLQTEAEARAGRGGSIGSRGSRSFSAPRTYSAPKVVQPARPSPAPLTSPPGTTARPAPTQPGSSFWRSFGGGLLGGLAGGLLFRSLFGGPPAQAAPGAGGGFGIGLLDILLLAGIAYMIYAFVRRRREEAAMAGGPTLQASGGYLAPEPAFQPPLEYGVAPEADEDRQEGLMHIKQMDPSFDEDRFTDEVMDFFFRVQGAWANRDLSPMRDKLTEEMYRIFQEDADRLQAQGLVNRLENIAVRSVDITEAWQEQGSDYITVRVYANLLDYMVDEKTGEIVSGSKTEPVKFEEYWTFTRPVGPNPWKLSAINQPV
jgi:predicted lipid-binding transport protein (Tim44 family)